MKNRLGILSGLILSLAIAGSVFASTGAQNAPQNNMTAKTKTSKMAMSKKTKKHRKHRTAKRAKMMKKKNSKTTAPTTK